jgi:MSHA biogenesis protein MshN
MTAIAAYRRALAQPKADGVWWVGLGVSLEATGEALEARNAYTSAAADPRLPAEVRRYVADRLTELEFQTSRRAAMAHVF